MNVIYGAVRSLVDLRVNITDACLPSCADNVTANSFDHGENVKNETWIEADHFVR